MSDRLGRGVVTCLCQVFFNSASYVLTANLTLAKIVLVNARIPRVECIWRAGNSDPYSCDDPYGMEARILSCIAPAAPGAFECSACITRQNLLRLLPELLRCLLRRHPAEQQQIVQIAKHGCRL